MTFQQMARQPECRVHEATIRYRIRVLGWTVEAAVSVRRQKRQGVLTKEQRESIIQDHKKGASLKRLMREHRVGIINLKSILEEAA